MAATHGARGPTRFIRAHSKPDCHIGMIASDEKRIHFWTRYPTYGREMRWYRYNTDPDAMEVTTAWQVVKVFHEIPCGYKTYLGHRPTEVELPKYRAFLDWPTYRPPIKRSDSQQKIPKIIMQTNRADFVPPGMRRAMLSILQLNPEYEYYYVSDRRVREFIATNFDARTLAAFDAVVPGAFKADLFRYCWLYKMGGVYLDADMEAGPQPLSRLIRSTDEFVSADDCDNSYMYNAFMACTPGHPFIALALETTVKHITDRDYQSDPLQITGPAMLQKLVAEYLGANVGRAMEGLYKDNTFRLVYHDCDMCQGRIVETNRFLVGNETSTVLRTPYYLYRMEMRWYAGKKADYYVLYDERKVYTDGNPPGTPTPEKK